MLWQEQGYPRPRGPTLRHQDHSHEVALGRCPSAVQSILSFLGGAERRWVFCLTKRDQAVPALSRPQLLLVAIARPAEIPPQRCPPLLPSHSRRHPAARPSRGGFMLPLAHFPLPAQHRHRWLQALQGRAREGGSCPSPEHPRGIAINQQPPACRAAGSSSRRQGLILPALEPGSSAEVLLLAGAAGWAAVGTCGCGALTQDVH